MARAVLRLLAPSGRYPTYSVSHPRVQLQTSSEMVWSACLLSPDAPEHVELPWCSPEEVVLLSAVALAEPDPAWTGRMWLDPWSGGLVLPLPFETSDLRDERVRSFLAENADKLRSEGGLPFQGPSTYSLVELGSARGISEIIDAVDVRDKLLLRGLAKVSTASSLVWQPWYMEEAALAAIIALEAAIELLRRPVGNTTERPNKTIEEVFSYIEEMFPSGTEMAGDLREFYKLRTIAVHPNSKFGPYWAPPILVDDCFFAIYLLSPLYRHILLGEILSEKANT